MTEWRLIEDGPGEAAWNMSVDEAIAESCRRMETPPTLRFYTWSRPAVTIGYFQKWDRDIDQRACEEEKIPVVRRITGGRAIYHGDDLTYCVATGSHAAEIPKTLRGAYLAINRAILYGIKLAGVQAAAVEETTGHPNSSPVCFLSATRNEIACRGRKLVGSAQRRWMDGMMQQGSVLLCNNPESYHRFFRDPEGRDPEEIIQECRKRIVGLNEYLANSVTTPYLADRIASGFERALGIKFKRGPLTSRELRHAGELALGKYLEVSWNRDRMNQQPLIKAQ